MADLKISALTASTTPLAGTEVLPIVQSSTTKQVSVANLTAGRAVSAANLTSLTNSQTGYTGLTLDNSSTFGTNNKYAQVAFTGRDTVNTTKTGAYVRGKPADDNLVGYGLQVFVRNSDTVAQSAEFTYQGNLQLNTGNLIMSTSGKGIDFSATAGTGTSELFADYEEGTWTPTDGSGAGLVFTGVVGVYTKVGRVVNYFGDVTYPVTANGSGSIIAGLPFTSSSSLNATGNVISTTVNAVGSAVPPSTSVVLVFPAGSLTPPTNATLSTARIIFAGSYQV